MRKTVYFDVRPSMTTTPLYGLPLLGKHTDAVESLHSYFCRLAYEHRLTPHQLASDVLPTHMSGTTSMLIGWNRNDAARLVSNKYTSVPFAAVLEKLTGQDGLLLGTFVPFDHLAHIGATVRAPFCPQCFEEDMERGQMPYERLLWRIRDVTCCPRHKLHLQPRQCSLPRRADFESNKPILLRGVCTNCGSVGLRCNRSVDDQDDEVPSLEELHWAEQFAGLLAGAEKVAGTPSADVKQALVQYCSGIDGGIAGLAARAGLAKSTVWHWLNSADARTSSDIVGRISGSEGISVVGLLTGDHSLKARKTWLSSKVRRLKKEVDGDLIRQRMQAAYEAGLDTVQAVAGELRVDAKTLKRYEPVLYRLIADRSLQELSATSAARHREAVGEAETVLCELLDRGQTPSLRNASDLTGSIWFPAELRSKALLLLRQAVLGDAPTVPREAVLGKAFREVLSEARVRLTATRLPVKHAPAAQRRA